MTDTDTHALYPSAELNRIMTEAHVPDLPEPAVNPHVRQNQWIELHAALDIVLARLIDAQVEVPAGTLAALLDLHRYVGVEEWTDLGDARCRLRVHPLVGYVGIMSKPLAAQLVRDMAT